MAEEAYSSCMINWTFAHLLSKVGTESEVVVDGDFDFHLFSEDAMRHVVEYTKLNLHEIPQAEVVSQQAWADINIANMKVMIEPFLKADEEASFGKTLLSGFAGSNVGLFVGFLSKNVLGQFDIAMFQPERKPRLLYIGSNLSRAVERLEVDRESFYRWIALHEVTHVAQFSSCTWLSEHLAGEMKASLEAREEKDTKTQQEHMDRIQGVMSVVEGYCEHVMDEVGKDVLHSYEGMRDKMEARRAQKSTAVKLLFELIGFNKKMEQYKLGKIFCDFVVEAEGIDKLNLVWRSPEDMPTVEEISNPRAWMKRVN